MHHRRLARSAASKYRIHGVSSRLPFTWLVLLLLFTSLLPLPGYVRSRSNKNVLKAPQLFEIEILVFDRESYLHSIRRD
jgi:hypothetical protein